MRRFDRRAVLAAIILSLVVGLGLGYLAGDDFKLDPKTGCEYQCRLCDHLCLDLQEPTTLRLASLCP